VTDRPAPGPQPTPPEGTYYEAQRIRSRKALRCVRCRYALSVCMCDALVPIPTRTRVLVVAHYIEAHKTTNTARLAVAALASGALRTRGHPERREPLAAPEGKRLVLYPSEGARELSPSDVSDDLVLVVPDGTWTQAGRIARRDPAALGAEHVRLRPRAEGSRYRLRNTHREGAVSTFEAIAAALGVLEGEAIERHLLGLFDELVRRALARREGSAG
jgi:DTW domain-containing protein YfiP